MPVRCPNCGDLMVATNDALEMGSQLRRFFCSECQIAYERDAAGSLQELEGHGMGSAPRRFRCIECEIVYERDAAGTLQELER